MTARPYEVTDLSGASDVEFAAVLERFDGEGAPESFDALAAVKRVAALAEVWGRSTEYRRTADLASRLRAAVEGS